MQYSPTINLGDELGVYSTNVGTGVSLSSFMTAVTIFFVGILITKFESFDDSIRIPIFFLIISTFGFLYSAMIYSNATGKLIRLKPENFQKNMHIGDVLSEYFGVYFLILSIPLAIQAITTDNFLKIATLIVSMVGLVFYHYSKFSVMEAHFKKSHYYLLLIILIFETSSFVMQTSHNSSYLIFSLLQVLFFLIIATISLKRKELDKIWE